MFYYTVVMHYIEEYFENYQIILNAREHLDRRNIIKLSYSF